MKTKMTMMLLLIGMIGMAQETVQIGSQIWMKQNLNIGTMIQSSQTQTLDGGNVKKWCYNNLESNCTLYGGLYQWDMIMAFGNTGAQGICPDGFRVPTMNDYIQLGEAIAPEQMTDFGKYNNYGGKLKISGNPWKTGTPTRPNKDGAGVPITFTDESGFSAKPAGWIYQGSSGWLGWTTWLWTSTMVLATESHPQSTDPNAYPVALQLYKMDNRFGPGINFKTTGLSLRCIKQ